MPDSQLLGIALVAMVAGVLLFRLYTILGRRNGHEPENAPKSVNVPASVSDMRGPGKTDGQTEMSPAERAQAPVGHGLLDIELADRSFDRTQFLKGARAAYEMILKAFETGDRLALKPLLSEEVYAAFDSEIAARAGAPPAQTLATVTDARIGGAELNGRMAEITVTYRAQFTATPNSEGAIGQRDVSDVWTFARSLDASDPNWTLVATGGAAP